MKVRIKFEDMFNMKQMLAFESEKNSNSLDLNSVKINALKTFEQATEYFSVLKTEKFADSNVEIIISQRDSYSPKEALAYFDMNNFKSDSKSFSFKLYADVLIKYLSSQDLNSLVLLWVHELMHMVDYEELLRNIELSREKLSTTERVGNSFYFSEIRKDKHVVLFMVLMHFRAEGIATLMAYLTGREKPMMVDGLSAIKEFDHLVANIFNLIKTIDYDAQTLNQYLNQINPLAYKLGAGVLLFGLSGKHPEIEDFKIINDCLLKKEPCQIKLSHNTIEKIRSFSSFDFLRFCMEKDWLANEVKYLAADYSTNIEIHSCFFELLYNVQANSDRLGFISLLRNLLREPLSLIEMEKEFKYMEKDRHIPDEVKSMTKNLILHLKQNPKDDLTQWALSYVFSTHDILDDSIEYFGYLDDVEVLNVATDFLERYK